MLTALLLLPWKLGSERLQGLGQEVARAETAGARQGRKSRGRAGPVTGQSWRSLRSNRFMGQTLKHVVRVSKASESPRPGKKY